MTEAYPDLKSNQNFLALQSQLEGTENRIAVARRDYIDAVREYNLSLRTFPTMIWAKTVFAGNQADGGIRRERCGANPAAGEVLTFIVTPRIAIRPAFGAAALRAGADRSAALRPRCTSPNSPAASSIRPTSFPPRRGARSTPSSPISRTSPASSLLSRRSIRSKTRDVESYANQLFRAWKLGEKPKNNGVLLLVAPKERKVRIEVGYGLEGTLTDALSNVIITNQIVPQFKAGDFAGGVERGVDGIIAALTTDTSDWQKKPQVRQDDQDSAFAALLPFLIVGLFIFIFWMMQRHARGRGGWGGGGPIFIPMGSSWGSGSSWGGGSPGAAAVAWRLFRRRRLIGGRRRLGQLVMAISPEDHVRIAEAIRAAEQKTSGEIVCVLARSSSEYHSAPVLVGALLALIWHPGRWCF